MHMGTIYLPQCLLLRERECCLLVLNLASSTLSCIRRPRPRMGRGKLQWGHYLSQAVICICIYMRM